MEAPCASSSDAAPCRRSWNAIAGQPGGLQTVLKAVRDRGAIQVIADRVGEHQAPVLPGAAEPEPRRRLSHTMRPQGVDGDPRQRQYAPALVRLQRYKLVLAAHLLQLLVNRDRGRGQIEV